jgi:ferredoxin
MCYCRHKMEHVGRACKAPKMICMTLNNAAASLIRNGIARRIDAIEGMDLLQEAYDYNLVQSGENVQRQVSFICNCCACCCDGLIAARKFGSRLPIQTSNYIPRFDADCCNGCGKCSRVCPAEAIHMQSRAQMGLPRMQPWTNRYALAAGYAYVTVLNKQFIWNQEFKESSPPWMYRVESSKWP